MSSLTAGKHLKGKYRLERKLANGGMGSLWVAFDSKLRRLVAVKLVHAHMASSEEACARFTNEAWLAARIHSPHVAQVFDAGIHRGTPFIVMELLEGEDLRSRLERGERLPVSIVVKMFEQILRGLEAVHRAGIVHRDLKPANVFLARVAGQEVVKLIDFGVARAPEPDLATTTQTGQMLGTPRYMSPEQARGSRDVDVRSDLWSVAVMLYGALTGEHAFPGHDIVEILHTICTGSVRPASELVANLPPGLCALLARALEQDPARRFQSASEMLAALTAVEESDLDLRRRAVTARFASFAHRIDETPSARTGADASGVQRRGEQASPAKGEPAPALEPAPARDSDTFPTLRFVRGDHARVRRTHAVVPQGVTSVGPAGPERAPEPSRQKPSFASTQPFPLLVRAGRLGSMPGTSGARGQSRAPSRTAARPAVTSARAAWLWGFVVACVTAATVWLVAFQVRALDPQATRDVILAARSIVGPSLADARAAEDGTPPAVPAAMAVRAPLVAP